MFFYMLLFGGHIMLPKEILVGGSLTWCQEKELWTYMGHGANQAL